jgi:DNA-binding transcriptional LysR family regulator
MPNMKLVEAFYWVARLHGFHAAAERLRLTQPSVSYRVKELERQLGHQLLIRGTRSVRLTPQGQAMFVAAERLMAAAQDMEQQFRPGRTIAGALRLGVNDAFAAICLPDLLRQMAADHPALEISVMVDHSYDLTHRLDGGEVDFAILSTPPVLPGLRYEPLGNQSVGWIGASPPPGSRPARAEWIAKNRIFVTPPPSNLSTIIAEWFQAAGLGLPRLNLCSSMSAILGLVRAGAGLSILPLPVVAADVAAGRLRLFELQVPFAPQGIFAAYNKGVVDPVLPVTLDAVRKAVRRHGFSSQPDRSRPPRHPATRAPRP